MKQLTLDFAPEKKFGARSFYLAVELVVAGKTVSRQTVFLAALKKSLETTSLVFSCR